MQPDREAPGRLGAAMDQRRIELRLRWTQVAERAGMSIGHLSRIRKDEAPPSPLAAANIETALEWAPGTVDRILSATEDAGQQPRDAPDKPTGPDLADIKNPSHDETAMMQILTALKEEIRQLKEQVQDLRDERDRQGGPAEYRKGA